MTISAQERAALASQLGVHDQYLYQCLTGRRGMDPAEAVRVEHESERRIRRWHLRQHDWHLIWPELLTDPDAPPVGQRNQVPRAA